MNGIKRATFRPLDVASEKCFIVVVSVNFTLTFITTILSPDVRLRESASGSSRTLEISHKSHTQPFFFFLNRSIHLLLLFFLYYLHDLFFSSNLYYFPLYKFYHIFSRRSSVPYDQKSNPNSQ